MCPYKIYCILLINLIQIYINLINLITIYNTRKYTGIGWTRGREPVDRVHRGERPPAPLMERRSGDPVLPCACLPT